MDDEKPSDNDLVIGTAAGILVVIKPDGRLIYGPEYTPDAAASALWEALARKRREAGLEDVRLARPEEMGLLGMEQRFNEWEPVMLALARADAANEIAQTRLNQLVGGKGAVVKAERLSVQAKAAEADSRLNECAMVVIQLAREHAVRKGVLREVPAEQVPAMGGPPDPKTFN